MKKIITRLKKINGQIEGIIKMFEKEEGCEKIIIQFQAVQSALDSAFSEALNDNLEICLKGQDTNKIKKIIKLISKK